MATTEAKPTNTIIVGPVRLSYLNVFKPRLNNLNGKSEYSAVLLIPKKPNEFNSDPAATYKQIKDKMAEIAKDRFGSNTRGVSISLKDGDAVTDEYPEPKQPGYWYMNVSAKDEFPPGLIDGDRNPAKPGEWVSGDWGLVKLAFYAYDQNVKKGVSAGLRAIQFIKKDEPLGASCDNTDGFDVVPGADKPKPVSDHYDPDTDGDPFAD